MSAWLVRQEGSPQAVSVPSAALVLAGLRDGNWQPTDEVKGPGDAGWQAFENHPTFAEAAAEMEPPKPEAPDETQLDMNPLIDVCLVLLIFFILTITYASLERAIGIPDENPDAASEQRTKIEDIRDKVFVITVKMNGDKPVIRIEKEEVELAQLDAKIQKIIDTTGRKEMVLDFDPDVPWGVETSILDAAKGKGIHNIINNRRK
jgi:biopolymer transport protein ExbD